jgi:hypothetical protein
VNVATGLLCLNLLRVLHQSYSRVVNVATGLLCLNGVQGSIVAAATLDATPYLSQEGFTCSKMSGALCKVGLSPRNSFNVVPALDSVL